MRSSSSHPTIWYWDARCAHLHV